MAKRTYTITNEGALHAEYPNLFKHVPDHSRIRKALAAGFTLPGIEFIPTPLEEYINLTNDQRGE